MKNAAGVEYTFMPSLAVAAGEDSDERLRSGSRVQKWGLLPGLGPISLLSALLSGEGAAASSRLLGCSQCSTCSYAVNFDHYCPAGSEEQMLQEGLLRVQRAEAAAEARQASASVTEAEAFLAVRASSSQGEKCCFMFVVLQVGLDTA
jgi:hypothetical protein